MYTVVEYRRPTLIFGRVIPGVVLGLFYAPIVASGLSIALFGLAGLLGLILKLASWFLSVIYTNTPTFPPYV